MDQTPKQALELIVKRLHKLKIKSEFELNIARGATDYQKVGFKKAQIRYKIYDELYKFVSGLYAQYRERDE